MSAQLPLRLPWDIAQDRWATNLNPIINNPIMNGRLIQNVSLVSGTNTVDHKLGRNLIGWFPVRIRTAVTLFDNQDQNQTPALTLALHASTAVVVDIYVF